MKRVNDIFHSLQGEGRNTGRAAAFVRFAGCNLRCPFCDTDFADYREMTDREILDAITPWPTRFVVLTGGEPTLQVDDDFVQLLHDNGYEVAMETNGTRTPPHGIDWLTVSPKQAFTGRAGHLAVTHCDELKVVFDGKSDPESHCLCCADGRTIDAVHRYLQPCDTGDTNRNRAITTACIDYICRHPQWRLSLQTHKLIGFK